MTSPGPACLEARALLVERGNAVLFDGLSFEARAGTLTHVRGDNGSGKTTLFRTLCGLVDPDAGEVRWRDTTLQGPATLAGELVYVGHQHGLCAELTAAENLSFAARTSACTTGTEVDAALARLGAASFAERQVRYLSAGQRQRVALARLTLFEAAVWMLDEPFTALDAEGRALVETLIEAHLEDGGLALIATHQAFSVRGDVRDVSLSPSA